jgi:hypothetical protein
VIVLENRRWMLASRLAAIALSAALASCASSGTVIASLSSQLRRDRVAGRGEGVPEEAVGRGSQVLPPDHRRLSRRASTLPGARLALAETYFNGEQHRQLHPGWWPSTAEFLTLYPSHPKSDYAQFQTAESYLPPGRTSRTGPDLDLKALDEYQRLLDVYPTSPHIELARLRVASLRQYLARAEFGAGYFYQKTRHALRAAIAGTRASCRTIPTTHASTRCCFALRNAWMPRAASPKRSPS